LLAQKKPRRVAITISDITRPVPNTIILPALLEVLHSQGIANEQITIVIGTGLHRPSTPAEKLELVGPEILRDVRVVDHRASDPDTLVRVSSDPPVSINKIFAAADFRIVTGLIEPHFMAGYSGGRKGVCPALVDLETVQRFHGHTILSDARATNGILEGNPCHAESLRIARLVGIEFLVNVAINSDRKLCGIYAGDMEAAHQAGVADVRRWTSAIVDHPFDIVVTCAGGFPLDQTFYQSGKSMVTALPACHAQTTLLVLSDCQEGIGSESFTQVMLAWSNRWREFLEHIAKTPEVRHDQWQAQMLCRVMERIGQERLWVACDGLPPQSLQKCWATPIPGDGPAPQRLQQALDRLLREHPGATVAVIPDGPYTLLQLRQLDLRNPENSPSIGRGTL
jgi:nickel-dependent lactate racemase